MQKIRLQVMLPFETVQDLNRLTSEWRMRSVGATIEELMRNFSQLIAKYQSSQKNLTEMREELQKWRDVSNESKTKRGPKEGK